MTTDDAEPATDTESETPTEPKNTNRQPHRVRLPGFIADDDIGLCDVITRTTSAAGIRPCGGCTRRAATLNQWVVFSGWSSPRR